MANRNKILQEALKLFSSFGYDGIGVQEIVKASGITKPTLYHYFGSKKGLLDALLKSHFGELIESAKTVSAYNGDLPEVLNRIARALFAFVKDNELFYRMQLSMSFAPPESESYRSVSVYNMELIGLLEDMFAQASTDHGNMKGRQKRYAFTFLGIINNYITLFLGGNIELDEQSVYNLVHQFSHGIYS